LRSDANLLLLLLLVLLLALMRPWLCAGLLS
jgi:hypothetical protein